jgi:hypothetical protein
MLTALRAGDHSLECRTKRRSKLAAPEAIRKATQHQSPVERLRGTAYAKTDDFGSVARLAAVKGPAPSLQSNAS